jgi:membrane complex biogenesis BtpA family protein
MVHMTFRDVFGARKPLIGMVHLDPLPGSPRWAGSMDAVLEVAVSDAETLVAGGLDGILIENFGDAPFFADAVPPETVAALAVASATVRAQVSVPVGVNVLRNDVRAALGIAAAIEAAFVRVNVHTGVMATDQGVIEGRAAQTLRARRLLGVETLIFADVLVKHAAPLTPIDLALAAQDTALRGLADAVLVTGSSTGRAADLTELRAVRTAVPSDLPVLAASGVTPATLARVLTIADGVIVGTALKVGGRTTARVDPERVRALVRAQGERPMQRR